MKEYKVRIEEMNARTIIIGIEDDKSEEDINEIVENLCDKGIINLDYEDFAERTIEIQGEAFELDKELFENYDAQSLKKKEFVCWGRLIRPWTNED